jgi:hypothetical protein
MKEQKEELQEEFVSEIKDNYERIQQLKADKFAAALILLLIGLLTYSFLN